MKKAKKIIIKSLSVMLAVVLTLTAAPLSGFVGLELPDWLDFSIKSSAAATSGTCGENLTWSFNESTGTLTIDGTGAMYDHHYKSIPWRSFKDCMETVVIGDSVTTICDSAFNGYITLTSVTIGDSVTSIGNQAFAYCSSLTSVAIPDSVTTICSSAFERCTSLTSVTIGDSVTTIGNYVFYYCTSLTSVAIGDSVTTIGDCAFDGCASLTSVTIPDSVTSIGNQAFAYCSSLTSVTIGDSVKTIGERAFSYCGSLTSVTIPNNVTSIGVWTFGGCESLTSVTIGDSVTTIGDHAFYCTGLTSITIPDSVTAIGTGAFASCDSLTSVTIGESVTTIGDNAFEGCDNLTSITIPDSVTTIGESSFNSCNSLTDVYYSGTEKHWKNISFGKYNFGLTDATIHFNANPKYKIYFSENESDWRVGNIIIIGASKTKGNYCGDYYPGNIRWEISNPSVLSLEKETYENTTGAYFKLLSHGDCTLDLYLDDMNVVSYMFSLNICESDLLEKYSDYLYNSSAFSVLETARDTCYDINFNFSKIEKGLSSFFYALENGLGVEVIAGEALAAAGLNRSIEEKVADEAMINVIMELMGSGDFAGDVVSKAKKIYDIAKKTGALSDTEYFDKYNEVLAKTCGCTVKQIETISNTFSELKKRLNLTFDVFEVTASALIYLSFNKEMVVDMMGATEYGSAPYCSLNRIYQRVSDVDNYVVTEFTSTQAVNLLSNFAGELFGKALGSTYDICELIADFSCDLYDELGGLNAEKYMVALNSWGYAGYFYNYSINKKATDKNFDRYFSYYVAATKAALKDAMEISKNTYLTNKADSLYSYINKHINYENYLSIVRKDLQNGNDIIVSNGYNSLGFAAFGGGAGGGGIRSLSTYRIKTNLDVKTKEVLSIPAYIDNVEIVGIENNGFENVASYQSVMLPQTIKTIGNYAFAGCNELSLISLNNGLNKIGEGTFYNCSALKIISVPMTVETVGNCAFEGCSSLENVSFGEKVKSIGSNAFKNCVSLKEICFENSDTIIPLDAFTGCKNLTIYGYEGSTAQSVANELGFTFVAMEKLVKEIKIVTLANQLSFDIGDEISTDGLTIRVTYANNTTETIRSGWSIACDNSVAGEQQVYICYEDEIISYPVIINDIKDKKLILSDIEVTLFITDSYQLTAECSVPDILNNLVWSSDNEDVAIVSDQGYVYAVSNGTTTIKVSTKNGESSAVCKVIVNNSEKLVATDGKIISSLFIPHEPGKYSFSTTGSDMNISATLYNTFGDVIYAAEGTDIDFYVWLVPDETYYVEFETTKNNAFIFSINKIDFVIPNEPEIPEYNYTFSIQTPSRTEIRNKDGIILHAKVDGTAPNGSYVKWESSNGNFDEDANGYVLEIIAKNKGWTTFTAILCDADGTELARSSVEMYSKSGFFDKIGGFFRSLFGTTKIYEN